MGWAGVVLLVGMCQNFQSKSAKEVQHRSTAAQEGGSQGGQYVESYALPSALSKFGARDTDVAVLTPTYVSCTSLSFQEGMQLQWQMTPKLRQGKCREWAQLVRSVSRFGHENKNNQFCWKRSVATISIENMGCRLLNES